MEIHARYYSSNTNRVTEPDSDDMFRLIRENRIKDLLSLFQSTPRDRLNDLVNSRNYDGMLPINYTIRCSANHLILIMLLRLGARYDDSTESPLFLAVRSGLMNLVKILVISGANVNALDAEGYTPLHWACFRKNVLMVRLLLKVADFTFHNHDRNAKRITPLGIAVELNCFELVRELLKCPKVDANIIDSKSHRYLYDLAAEHNQFHACLEMEAAFKRNSHANPRALKRNFHDLHEFRVEAVIQHQLRSQLWLSFQNDPRGTYELYDNPSIKLPLLPDHEHWQVVSEPGSLDSGWKYSFLLDEEQKGPLLINYAGDAVVSGGSIFNYMDNYRHRILARTIKTCNKSNK